MGWNATDLKTPVVPLAFSNPAANAAGGTQRIVYEGFTVGQGGNGTLHLILWTNSNGWGYGGELTSPTSAPRAEQFTDLASYYFAGQNSDHIDYIAVTGHIYELLFDEDGWSAHDLSSSANARVDALNGPSAFEFKGIQEVFYRGQDLRVHELWWDVQGWHHRDLTALTGSPTVHASGPTCYGFQAQSTQHVVYVASGQLTGGHVHELWRDNQGWHHGGSLTGITGAPLADGQPTGYAFEAQFTQHVHYRGVDGQIHELRWGTDTNGWHYWGSPSELAGAPAAAGDPKGYVFVPQDTQHVVYMGLDRHVHELWSDGAWHHNDLTVRTSAPLAGSDPAGYSFNFLRDTQHVVYNSDDHHIIELAWTPLATNPKALARLTANNRSDIVGFGDDGVWVSLSQGDGTFDVPNLAIRDLGYVAGGWRVDRHPRLLADVTGEGRSDIVGFGDAGVYVALSRGDGTFDYAPQTVINDLGYQAGGWRVDRHPRMLADITGDGRADIVGFGDAGVYVALSRGDGTFDYTPVPALEDFGYQAGGWRVDRHPRMLADITGNGRADIVAFGDAGVYVALSRGDGTFDYTPMPVLEDFGYVAGGWRVDRHPRFLADLRGIGRADIVGFGNAGVNVALSRGDGTFDYVPEPVVGDLGYVAGGWRVDRHPRLLADLRGNGRFDIVGFGNAGVYVALSRGDGTFDYTPQPTLADFGFNEGWRVDRNPRFLAGLTGNGRADIVGFADVGVRTALSNGNGTFMPKRLAAPDFGFHIRSW